LEPTLVEGEHFISPVFDVEGEEGFEQGYPQSDRQHQSGCTWWGLETLFGFSNGVQSCGGVACGDTPRQHGTPIAHTPRADLTPRANVAGSRVETGTGGSDGSGMAASRESKEAGNGRTSDAETGGSSIREKNKDRDQVTSDEKKPVEDRQSIVSTPPPLQRSPPAREGNPKAPDFWSPYPGPSPRQSPHVGVTLEGSPHSAASLSRTSQPVTIDIEASIDEPSVSSNRTAAAPLFLASHGPPKNDEATLQSVLRQIPRLLAMLSRGRGDQQLKAVQGIADLAHNGITGPVAAGACRDVIAKQGGIPPVVAKLQSGGSLALHAARALANLTCDSKPNVAAVVQCGGIEALASLLGPASAPVETQAKVAGVLHNLTFEFPENRRRHSPTHPPSLATISSYDLETPSLRLLLNRVTLHSLHSLTPRFDNDRLVVEAGCVPRLVALLGAESSANTKVQAAAALGVISQEKSMGGELSETIGVGIPDFLEILKDEAVSASGREHVLRTLANIAFLEAEKGCGEVNAVILASGGGIQRLASVISSPRSTHNGRRFCAYMLHGISERYPEIRPQIADQLSVREDEIESALHKRVKAPPTKGPATRTAGARQTAAEQTAMAMAKADYFPGQAVQPPPRGRRLERRASAEPG